MFSTVVIYHVSINSLLCWPHMVLILSVLQVLCIGPILSFVSPEIKLKALEAEHLPLKGQFGCQDFGAIILTSAPVPTRPSILMSFICIVNLGLWLFIEVC